MGSLQLMQTQELPPLSTRDYEALRDDIARRGIINPIIVNADGAIIDGHHRYEIAQELGIPCPTTTVALDENESSIIAWALNFKRRSVTLDQKREAALMLNQRGMTQQEIADRVGVAQRTVSYWLDATNSNIAISSKDQRIKVAKWLHPEIYDRSESGETQAQLAADYECSRQAIGKIIQTEVKRRQRESDIESQRAAIDASKPDVPTGEFQVIVIDPPWPYDGGNPKYDPHGRRAANPYPEMTLEELAALELPAAKDCVLWLWTTHKFMRHSFPLLDSWGFQDKAITTWVKDRMGLGSWLRSQSEFCIMAVKGRPEITLTNQTTVFHGPMREHSRKPDEFYELVEGLCVGRKLDFFSREARPGWAQFGNDGQKFN